MKPPSKFMESGCFEKKINFMDGLSAELVFECSANSLIPVR